MVLVHYCTTHHLDLRHDLSGPKNHQLRMAVALVIPVFHAWSLPERVEDSRVVSNVEPLVCLTKSYA